METTRERCSLFVAAYLGHIARSLACDVADLPKAIKDGAWKLADLCWHEGQASSSERTVVTPPPLPPHIRSSTSGTHPKPKIEDDEPYDLNDRCTPEISYGWPEEKPKR